MCVLWTAYIRYVTCAIRLTALTCVITDLRNTTSASNNRDT